MKNYDKQLIYIYIENISNRAKISHEEIQISCQYQVDLNRMSEAGRLDEIRICNKKSNNIYDGFFGNNIINISALVGINGIGKTTILNLLGSARNERKRNKYEWQYFALYKIENYYIIEGCDKSVIERLIVDCQEWQMVDDEYSIICEYDEKRLKLKYNRLCSEEQEKCKSIKYFFYRDKSMNFIDDLYGENDIQTDYPVCFSRDDLKYRPESVYKMLTDESLCVDRKALGLEVKNIGFSIFLKKPIGFDWEDTNNKSFNKMSFIIEAIASIGNCMCNEFKDKIPYFDEKMIQRMPLSIDMYEKIKEALLENINYDEGESIIERILPILESLDETYFAENSSGRWANRKISSTKVFADNTEFVKSIYELLESMTPDVQEFIGMTCTNISAGQMKAIDVFSSILATIDVDENNRTYIILLDEPEKGFHPEMARNFINNIVTIINSIDRMSEFQFIITSHSPFIISDIPTSFIHCLEFEKDTNRTKIKKTEMGLLSNIPDIMRNTFYLKSPFGAYAEKYFQEVQNKINILDKNMKNLNSKIDFIKDIINEITEPTLKRYLIKLLDDKLDYIFENKEMELIEFYQNRIEELKNR